jgi:hypothetical protein
MDTRAVANDRFTAHGGCDACDAIKCDAVLCELTVIEDDAKLDFRATSLFRLML